MRRAFLIHGSSPSTLREAREAENYPLFGWRATGATRIASLPTMVIAQVIIGIERKATVWRNLRQYDLSRGQTSLRTAKTRQCAYSKAEARRAY